MNHLDNEKFDQFNTPLSPMRLQSQLGKEVKRMYKEGQNVVKLSLARVVKVNYKYNTVDVVTVQGKDAFVKNPNDNGKYSARLPVKFGGRTPDGNVYGSTTLATVGSLVLIGFLEGNKEYPIVLNIYSDSDNQSQLTRTTFTGGDIADEDMQRELWQIFDLYPSMTYKNIDGNGNQEITFSGKSFMYITDTDPDNAYVQDGAFDYQDLPSSRYADGELIEPKSPNAPTVLYVHQGIYDNHRVTMFIKADGTFRLGSRHVEGEGITFMQMGTDGAFEITQKKDTADPEQESTKFSKFGITPEGFLVLKSQKHLFEVNNDGVYVDGKPIAAFVGGTDPDGNQITFQDIIDGLNELKTSITVMNGVISTKISRTEYNIGLEDIKEFTEELVNGVNSEIEDIGKQISDLDSYIDGAFKDGIIDESEAKVIQGYINTINTEKADIDGKYTEIYNNKYLSEAGKASLKSAKDAYDAKHDSLIAAIHGAIVDGKITQEDRDAVNQAFAEYRAALGDLSKAFESAADIISFAKAKEALDDAKDYVNGEIKIVNSEITQLAESITSKVDSTTFTNAISDVNSKIAATDETLTKEIQDTNSRVDDVEKNVTYKADILSTNGNIFRDGSTDTTLFCKVYHGNQELTNTLDASLFKWTRVSDDAAGDEQWNNAHSSGMKSVHITAQDVPSRATFTCDVTGIAAAQISIIGFAYDITISDTPPENPTEGTLWMNTSGEPPYRLYIYKNGNWDPTDYDSLRQLDPDAYDKIQDTYNAITDLDLDNRLTRYERSVVRGELANIIGVYLSATDDMPTLAEVDANGVGSLYTLRQQAREIGVPITDADYVKLGDAYTALRTYLSSLSIKPWDIDSSETLDINSDEWDAAWNGYYYAANLLEIKVTKRQKEYSDIVADGAKQDAIKAVSNAQQFQEVPLANPTIINSPITSLGLPSFQGRHVDLWSMNPDAESSWALNGNRLVPITNPIFNSAGSLTLYTKLYGDGTINDEFTWDLEGRAVKIKRWDDVSLDGTLDWKFDQDFTGYKQVKFGEFSEYPVADMAIQGVKYDGAFLAAASGTTSAADEVMVDNDTNTLFITVSDTDSGWGESYTPTEPEIKAYFNGWRMCNGTFGVPYDGTGSKVWYPIGDTDLSRSTMSGPTHNPVPTDSSPTIKEQSINEYQIVYRYIDAIQQAVTYDGILSLLEGENSITIDYPVNTPPITDGKIKYATNLATVTDSLKYLIPTMQRRISKAEEKITDSSIVNTVTQSIEYQIAMSSKASVEDLGNYATSGELDDLSKDVNDRITNAVNAIDFSPYVTKSELEQTANNITAKFYATGGLNLIKNSIGFAGLDFWDLTYPPNLVETIRTNELDSLGFGSGFLFKPDGVNKGIAQTVKVNVGQPYTLSWYLNKRTGGDTMSYRFWVQIQEDGVTKMQIADNSTMTNTGYDASHMTYIPQSDTITVRFIGYADVDATLTGIMLTIGDVPLQWSLATGEVYNTHIRMDVNGIRVSQLDENRKEIGYTQITPQEFAGYYDAEGNGSFQKIFYLNGEETVTKKLRAETEMTMGPIKILNIETETRRGWAYVPNID